MSIHKIGSDLVRPLPAKGSGTHGRKVDPQGSSPGRRERTDQVGFSPEGLALAGEVGTEPGELSAERLEVFRGRIASGFYDDPTVAEEVARRLIASGDLDAAR